jgi:rhamnopyranosyl-N-acetylglucosaminyl-diphospho-decaprenol beta-1,3/1,4-galactofuranosyltransferase
MSSAVAIVVTFNRKVDLIQCLSAIFSQTKLPNKLLIIDNASTDGTPEELIEQGVLTKLPALNTDVNQTITESKLLEDGRNIVVSYTRKAVNDGGAGGFYEGMKQGYDGGFDYLWMMDDDGVPHKEQLAQLVSHSAQNQFSFVNALLINMEDNDKLAFGLKGYQNVNDIAEKDYIYDFINPFNGTLLKRELIEKIGLIKREMFIWGDEKEYALRAKKYGYKRVTILDALHYHPKIKGETVHALPLIKGLKVVLKPEKMAHFYYRNLGYLEATYASSKVSKVTKLAYLLYFTRNLNFSKARTFIKSYNEGARDDFSNSHFN